jgi:hypothetical protein
VIDTHGFSFGHFMAGVTAVIAAFASLAGGLAALGFTRKETQKVEVDNCEQRINQIMQAYREGAGLRHEKA